MEAIGRVKLSALHVILYLVEGNDDVCGVVHEGEVGKRVGGGSGWEGQSMSESIVSGEEVS